MLRWIHIAYMKTLQVTEKIKTAPKKPPLPQEVVDSIRFPIRFPEFENGENPELKIAIVRPLDYLLYFIVFLISFTVVKIFHGAKILGKKRLPRDRGALIISNHSLFIEPPYLAYYSFPGQNYFTSNLYNLKAPILGNFLRHVNTLPLFQGPRFDESRRFILRALERSHVLFYPEGHLSHMSNRMLEFKLGAFRLAVDEGLDIYPLIFFKRRIRIGSFTVPLFIRAHSEIQDPVSIKDFRPDNGDREEWAKNLADHCYDLMQSRLNEYISIHSLEQYPLGS